MNRRLLYTARWASVIPTLSGRLLIDIVIEQLHMVLRGRRRQLCRAFPVPIAILSLIERDTLLRPIFRRR